MKFVATGHMAYFDIKIHTGVHRRAASFKLPYIAIYNYDIQLMFTYYLKITLINKTFYTKNARTIQRMKVEIILVATQYK